MPQGSAKTGSNSGEARKSFDELRREAEALISGQVKMAEEQGTDVGSTVSKAIERRLADAKKRPSSILVTIEPEGTASEPEDGANGTTATQVVEETDDDNDEEAKAAYEMSLTALLDTLNSSPQPETVDPPESEIAQTDAQPTITESVPDALVESDDAPTEAETASPISALEGMPPPIADATMTPLPPRLRETPPKGNKKRPDSVPGATNDDLQSALRTFRNSVSDLELPPAEASPLEPQPIAPQPTDGMPKSSGEDLPKFELSPRKRMCNRCGNETKLRDEKCQTCGRIDPSLGVLDAVIAGDVGRVDKTLLVKPTVIGVRTSKHDWTLLHMAAAGGNRKMVELLVGKGASINAINKDGKSPLHYAASKGYNTIVKILLECHADVTLQSKGLTARDMASKNGHVEIADLLEVAGG